MFRPRHRRREQLARDWRQRRGVDADPVALPEQWVERPSRDRRRSRMGFGGGKGDLLRLALGGAPSRVAAAVCAAFLTLVLPVLLLAPRYRIQAVEVTGNSLGDRNTIVQASGLVGRNALLVDPQAVAYRVGSLPGIEAAQLRLSLPRQAVLTVVERPPVLLWQDRSGRRGVDAHGSLLSLAAPPDNLPLVTDEGDTLRQGIDCLPADTVRTAVAYAERFGPLSYRPSIGFVARAPEGWEVWLGADAAMLEQQAALLTEERQALQASGTAIRLLDLRFPSRPYYR